jgi:hypothetical protein
MTMTKKQILDQIEQVIVNAETDALSVIKALKLIDKIRKTLNK